MCTSIYTSIHKFITSKSCLCALLVSVHVLLVNRVFLDIESELLFFSLQLLLELLVGIPDRLDHEETINLFKRNTAGLGDEEEGEEEGEEG